MSTPRLTPCTPADLLAILNRDGQSIGADHLLCQLRSGIAYCAAVDGVPLGCGGIVIPWPGVGLCWMLLAKEAGRSMFWITRMVRSILDDVQRVYGLHRMEAIALKESERNQRWFALLGFTVEKNGVARAYFSDQRSVVRFERVREES